MENMEIKKILLTGGAGFIGSHLLELLLQEKYEITVLERSSVNTWRINHLRDSVKYYSVDKMNLEDVFKTNTFDCILHLATFYKKHHENIEDIRNMVATNILFPTELLELSSKYNTRYFINTGTFFEYKLDKNKLITEDSTLKPYDLYAATKVSFENILKYYTNHYPIKGVTLKLFAPYGEKDNEKLIIYLIKNLLENKSTKLTYGEQKLNFTYIKDITQAYLKTLEYICTMKKKYDFFNIGQSRTVSVKDAVAILEKISNKKLSTKWGSLPYAKNEIFYANCDSKKAKNVLGWKPRYYFKKGLEKTYLYYLNEYEHGNL